MMRFLEFYNLWLDRQPTRIRAFVVISAAVALIAFSHFGPEGSDKAVTMLAMTLAVARYGYMRRWWCK